MSTFPAVAPWPPVRHTAPLVADFVSAADPWLPILDLVWRGAFRHGLEDWQTQLVRAILEVCPEGHPRAGKLRYRQVLISVGRQNGKSEIAAFLGILFLLARMAPLVIGIASSADQARIVYRRAMQAVLNNRALSSRFVKATDTRGILTKTGGAWEIKAAKEGALQGLPIDLGVVDEVHLLVMALWTALVNGMGGRDDCIVVGITTAGDDESELLKHLYALAESGEVATFGFFIWEAPEARIPKDDEELGYFLKLANPSVASGRVSLENVIADVRSNPDTDGVRYKLNRFVASTSGYLPAGAWQLCAVDALPAPPSSGVVFAVDRTPDWGFATITASWRLPDGVVATEVVRSIVRPTHESLKAAVLSLANWGPRAVVVDSYTLKALGLELKRSGLPVQLSGLGDLITASSLFYAKTVQRKIQHPGDGLLAVQLPGVRRRNVGDAYKLSRTDSSVNIDAVMSTVMGVYFADTLPECTSQLF